MQGSSPDVLFCADCSSILSFEQRRVFCYTCDKEPEIDIEGICFVTRSSSRVFEENRRKHTFDEEREEAKGTLIKEQCPECGNPEMRFQTMQLRSVDEGQTVFYTCPKCDHKFALHT
ncbi:MAG: DNA-directed RNA polymerase I subunit RPA12 [Amphiamblys sp. WSBS2006]|nr:MAG: DNA-directed RNA polymerase I subunit RPA12 [Amphiamblys sp. WSBS2006]